jgi:multidrug efflux pump subunit AcrB
MAAPRGRCRSTSIRTRCTPTISRRPTSATALARQNLITPVGTEKIGSYEYTIDLNDSPKAIEDFNNLPIKVVDGAVVFMRDVALSTTARRRRPMSCSSDGRKGVLMSVLKIGSASTLDIIAGVKARLPAIQATLAGRRHAQISSPISRASSNPPSPPSSAKA